MWVSVEYPGKLVSLNESYKQHWRKRATRVQAERAAAFCELYAKLRGPVTDARRVEVTLTRVAPRPLDSHDNLPGAFKGTVDGICDWLGIPDHDPRVRFSYMQERGAPRYYGTRISLVVIS